MIIYRPHRGGLKEAMELRKIFKTEAEMFEYISGQNDGAVSVEDLSIGEILGDDPRIGWKDCRYVLIGRYRNEHFAVPQVIGTCSYQWAND